MAGLLLILGGCFLLGLFTRSWLLAVGFGFAIALYGFVFWLVHRNDDVQENWDAIFGLAVLFVGAPIVFITCAAGVPLGRWHQGRHRSTP